MLLTHNESRAVSSSKLLGSRLLTAQLDSEASSVVDAFSLP